MTKQEVFNLIAAVGTIDDKYATEKEILMAQLDEQLTSIIAPVVEEAPKRKPANKSGLIQIDPETGKIVANFATLKEANIAMGKKEKSTNIAEAARGFERGRKAYGYNWCYADQYNA